MVTEQATAAGVPRAPTGIPGLDVVTRGGLPRGRMTFLVGGAGTGKTILGLQSLAWGARHGESAILVSFEEAPAQITANVRDFAWADGDPDISARVRLIDARPDPDLVHTGDTDLSGLIAMLDAAATPGRPGRVVLDGIDAMLALIPDPRAARRELYRLQRWLLDRGLTALVTAKDRPTEGADVGFLEYLADCVIALRRELTSGTLQRSLWVMKFRGSAFDENEAPMVIGPEGIEVAAVQPEHTPAAAPVDRISSGIPELDVMLAGGYYRGASILLTGAPGTAKTTLAAAFAAACAARGEPTLFLTFDSPGPEVVRNVASVGIDLAGPLSRGLLSFEASRSAYASAEQHLLHLLAAARRMDARAIIIDPVSAFAKPGNIGRAAGVTERLVDWAKRGGVTLLMTSLLDETSGADESTPVQISTIADTWIHLVNHTQAGERNRAVSIVKSRGAAHSNQVRELILTASGPTFADVYRSGGGVLMGTARWEREESERQKLEEARRELERRKAELAATIAALEEDLLRREHERARLEDRVAARREGERPS